MAALLAGRTTFVIAHRLSTIRRANLILLMEEGRIIERGTHEQLMTARGTYYDMVLQRRAGNWELASVWLGPEVEKPSAITSSRRAPKTN